MARKKRRQNNNKKNATKMTLQDRATSAENALQYGHFKKAIVHLKVLLNNEKRAEWIEWTQTAHSSLAQTLFRDKKFQELVKLYVSGHRLCDLSLENPLYIDSLLQINHVSDALTHYLQLLQNISQNEQQDTVQDSSQQKIDKVALSSIRSRLAAAAIAGESKILEGLPADDSIVADFDNAFQLLEAYCHSDDEAVARYLKLISFRSPYRDLRQIIAAAVKLDGDKGDKEKSRDSLAQIVTDSAFSKLAELLHLLSQNTGDVVSSFSSMNAEAKSFIQQVKGWQDNQGKILKRLASLPEEPDFMSLFRIADECKSTQSEYCAEVARVAVVTAMAKGNRVLTLKRYEKRFKALSPAESAHMLALESTLDFQEDMVDGFYFDLEEGFESLEEAWEDYLHLLDEETSNQDIPLSKALVYRQFATNRFNQHLNELLAAKYLRESLVFDPSDKESHIQLIRYYLDIQNLQEARYNINLALQYYSDDLQILLLAVEVATASGAYKKATQHAKAILAVDPINRQARELLCNAHLAHSRKQAKSKKWHLLEKELKEVEHWGDKQVVVQAAIPVLRAIMAVAQKQRQEASEYLQQLCVQVESDLNASLMIYLESASTGANAKELHKLAKLNWMPAKKQAKDILFSLIKMSETCLKSYPEEVIQQAFKALSATLKFIHNKGFSLQDYEKTLAFWHRIQRRDLLDAYVDKAVKDYGEIPMTTYYQYVNNRYLNLAEYEKVSEAISEAREQGDSIFLSRLIALIEKCGPPMPPQSMMEGSFFDFDEEDFDTQALDKLGNLEGLEGLEGLASLAGLDDLDDLDDADALFLLPKLIRTTVSDKDVFLMVQDLMGMSRSEANKFRDIVGKIGLREMLIAFLIDNIEPEDFIANYNVVDKKDKTQKKANKKNTQQMNLFGDNDK